MSATPIIRNPSVSWGEVLPEIKESEEKYQTGLYKIANEVAAQRTINGQARKEAALKAKVKLYPLKSVVAKAIIKNAHEINYGEYDLPTDIKDRQGNLVCKAGHWTMVSGKNGDIMLMRNQDVKSAIKAGDTVIALRDFKDAYGTPITSGQHARVIDAYNDVCEISVLQTGLTHVCNASDIMNACETKTALQNKKQAALVVPKKFQEMIKARTNKPNNDVIDTRLWAEFVREAGNSLNNYSLMENWLDRAVSEANALDRAAGQKNRKADTKAPAHEVDQATKDYYKDLFGQTDDPSYATELTGAAKLQKKRVSIKKTYNLLMEQAPSRNALSHHRNVVAKLAQQFGEDTGTIASIVASQDPITVLDELPMLFTPNL